MKERPIIFSASMVRAIIDGRKTQTRRVVKWPIKTKSDGGKQRLFLRNDERNIDEINRLLQEKNRYPLRKIMCPYGQPGDLLWARETFAIAEDSNIEDPGIFYRADGDLPSHLDDSIKWKPSIHMPKWAARLWLEVTGIRVERVQEINSEDIRAEGTPGTPHDANCLVAERELFHSLWNSINGKKPGCSWEDNPYVWAVEFKAVE
jgi:hypothetical protein